MQHLFTEITEDVVKIRTHYDIAARAIDVLMDAWQSKPKGFPFNKKRAVVPQRLLPPWLVEDKLKLSLFLFFACLYMKGRITSEQAFKMLLVMLEEHPDMFDLNIVQSYSIERIEDALEKYVNRDIEQVAKAWKINAQRLVKTWGGDPRNIFRGVRSWDESLRRIQNKMTKGSLIAAITKGMRSNKARTYRQHFKSYKAHELKIAAHQQGIVGVGFEGFQVKMVSMLVYFFDWAGLLEHRFIYPAPADFHNLRFAFAVGAMSLHPQPYATRYTPKLATAWSKLVMRYRKDRGHDPLDVADVLWLFSIVACGESPLTEMREERTEDFRVRHLFKNGTTKDGLALIKPDFMNRKFTFAERLAENCLICPFLKQCKFTIPASPYYQSGKGPDGKPRGGQIYFIERPPIENRYVLPRKPDPGDEQLVFEW